MGNSVKRLEGLYARNERLTCAALIAICAFVFFFYGNPWFIDRESPFFSIVTGGSVSVAFVAAIRFFQGSVE